MSTETTAPDERGPGDEVARLKAELARTRAAAQELGKAVRHQAQSMEAARIEMIQNGPEAAMQWILNSIPDVDDNAPEDQWDGTETAGEWLGRVEVADRAAAKARAGSPPDAAPDEFGTLQGAAAPLGAAASAPCRCEPGAPCGAHGGEDEPAALSAPAVDGVPVDTRRPLPTRDAPSRGRSGPSPSGPSDPREALGRVVHETRCTFGATLDRPFLPAPWEERHPRQQELDMQIGEAVAAAERERIRQMAVRTGAICPGDEGTNCYFADLIRGDDRG